MDPLSPTFGQPFFSPFVGIPPVYSNLDVNNALQSPPDFGLLMPMPSAYPTPMSPPFPQQPQMRLDSPFSLPGLPINQLGMTLAAESNSDNRSSASEYRNVYALDVDEEIDVVDAPPASPDEVFHEMLMRNQAQRRGAESSLDGVLHGCAKAELWMMQQQRDERRRMRAVVKKVEKAIEKERQERERTEALQLQTRRDELERREKEAVTAVEDKMMDLTQFKQQHGPKVRSLEEKVEEQLAAIEQLKAEILGREAGVAIIRDELESLDTQLDDKKAELQQALDLAADLKQQRIVVTREADEHPHSLTLQYNRGCIVCLAANPLRRAVLTACGHMTCVTCAEKLADDAGTEMFFACPLCRKRTFYVKVFEEVVETQQVRQSTQGTRKRHHDDDDLEQIQID